MQEYTVGRSLLRHFANCAVRERPLRLFNVLCERLPLFSEEGRVDGDSYILKGLCTLFCRAPRQGLRIIFCTVHAKSNGHKTRNENPGNLGRPGEFLFKKVRLF